MKVQVEDLTVLFPYDYVYPEQYNYMLNLKKTLDGVSGHCLLEMPTGTGKTVSLLSLILSYQAKNPSAGKLVYCTRTVQEMDKVVEELRRVVKYHDQVAQEEKKQQRPMLGVCLSSRRNMCIHPHVSAFDNRDKVDALCRNLTAQFVRERKEQDPNADVDLCEFYEGYKKDASDASLSGIYSLDDMRDVGRSKKWCPYFVARHLINLSTVVVYNYQYMLDPKISGMVSRDIEKDSIVVFDEAHNIDNVCIEALSVLLDRQTIHSSRNNVRKLRTRVAKMEKSNSQRLADEYKSLVRGLAQSGALGSQAGAGSAADDVLANPVLPDDVLQEAVPGNIRRARNFVNFLQTFIEFLSKKLKLQRVTTASPAAFLAEFQRDSRLTQQARALKFSYDRLASLLRTLEIVDIDEFTPLQMVTNFATLVATYSKGFTVLFEPFQGPQSQVSEPTLQLCCLDASLAIKPVFERFRNVVITSGTLSPLDMYRKILQFHPKISESLPMTLSRNCIHPMVVTKGSDQVPITSRYDQRSDTTVIRNYGQLLCDMAATVPDGIVCFFTSYSYMEHMIEAWDKMGVLQNALQHKLLFIETKDIVETTLALDLFKKACDCGRGAIFFSVARGKVAEGIDFDGHYGRCVMLLGIPFQYTLSRVLEARLKYLKEQYEINESEYLTFDAIRQASQCVGRVIRSKTDYGLMVFADVRYSRNSKLRKLPQWITQYMDQANRTLSTDTAVQQARDFLKKMAQPRSKANELGVTMLNEAQVARLNVQHTNASASSSSAGAQV